MHAYLCNSCVTLVTLTLFALGTAWNDFISDLQVKEQTLIFPLVPNVKFCIARILLGFYYDFLGFCQDLPMSFLGPPWDLLGPPGDLLGLARTS